jgi:hypothetical protein
MHFRGPMASIWQLFFEENRSDAEVIANPPVVTSVISWQ